jgi:serine/threonine protein kinase/Tfp pilus assembly protein PilF
MIGQTVSHYKILEKLGEGGMGVVYKAQDTKLDRFVALKFLPAHISKSEQEKSRFIQEAKSASALNHPNVCTIYGIDEYEGQQFIEMELVDGITLREKIETGYSSGASLNMKQVIEYGFQIADALQEAHAKGITHRDVKAENIMVNSKNQIKVMDFGLAKLKGSLKLTRTSSTIGTLAYMSPEQIQGKEADPRSDIFSYGVVLFEMATGRLPFRGEHEAAIMYSIVNEEPENAQKYRTDIPSELQHIIKKSLEKDPEDRYQTMSEIMVDLRRLKKESTRIVRTQEFRKPDEAPVQHATALRGSSLTGFLSRKQTMGIAFLAVIVIAAFFLYQIDWSGIGGNDKKVIVVLPFENLGPSDKDYFVDGMTDEVTSRLSGLSGLSVIARSSAVQYKNTTKTFKQIGSELGVTYILTGTVRWDADEGQTRVRVNPSLIKVKDGTQTWSESMESVLSTAFKLQSEIASRVAGAMNIALAKTEQNSLETALTQNSAAYDNYLQAVEYAERNISKNDQEIAVKLFERAVKLDPNFAAAYARLAKAHAGFYWFFYDRTAQRAEMARMAAEKAIQLSPELSEAHEAMGWVHYHTKLDYVNALKSFDRALKYRPSNAQVHYGIAAVMRRQGNIQGSIDAFKRSIEANPRASDILRQLGETLTLQRNYAEADQHHVRSLELAPDISVTYFDRIKNLLLWKGDLPAARTLLAEALRLGKVEETEFSIDYMHFLIEKYEGKYDAALSVLDKLNTNAVLNTQFSFAPNVLLRARLEKSRGNMSLARKYFDSAVVFLERKILENKEDERIYSALGIAYAGSGKAEKAIANGNRGVELLPVEKEAWRGSFRLIELAEIYVLIGDQEKAVDLLKRILSIPAELSPVYLKLDPTWRPLKNNKRFQTLVNG